MPHTTTRRNVASKIAYLSDIQRIVYTVTFSAFAHAWAMVLISKLIPSAYTVLMFFAALHRCSKFGYIGCAVAYELLSPQIVKATGRKCAPRTLKRGLAFLKRLGLVELRPWTMPDQTIRSGDRTITVKGTARVDTGAGRWATRQIVIVVLTERAVALWDKATAAHRDRYLPPLLTRAKMALNSQVDQVVKPTMVDPQSSKHVTVSDSRNCRSDNAQASHSNSKQSSTPDLEGNPTRPEHSSGERSSAQTSGHRPLTCPPPANQTQPKQPADKATNAAYGPSEAQTQRPGRGCSAERPRIPLRAPRSYNLARIRILAELHRALENFSTRQADAIYCRAKRELDRDYPTGCPTSVDWRYWIGRFPDYQPKQRRYHMMRDILPLLKNPAAVTPNEPRRYTEGLTEGGQVDRDHGQIEQMSNRLPDLLSRLKNKFC